MSFCIYDSDIALCTNEQVVIYNLENDAEQTIRLPELQIDKKIDLHNNVNIETFHTLTNVTFSNDGKYFFVCTNRKQLCLYERRNQNLLSNQTLVRAASKVRFTPSNDIVVADKTGDAYLFPSNKSENGILLLGHLSMLLDVLVTEDEKYIITTDRDEKIRVSMFPNSYNIMSYCLGHKKFVTNILELPHDKSILVSCGGDGVFILWDYENGKELLSVDFCNKISKNDIDNFNQKLQDCHLDETVEILPVKHLRLSVLDTTSSLVVMSFYDNSLLLAYIISGTKDSKFKATYIQSIILDCEPTECHFYEGNLWLLNEAGFQVYKFEQNKFVLSDVMNFKLNRLNSLWKTLRKDSIKQNLFPILYKRKYDNVQEYLERKKTRLSTTPE
ncbi:PREDICTED: tRNA (guanine-N(7)-)-methyltransferase non-catalytic subunit wdr4 [Dufourea novaeangliae]|uniref:tRNA (Guanine-N(7)-)-methyltransferase subunit WDR4 n=1 Tax=Dufourea novaeangliae TaxID=178035 RepID=A0A154PLV7_DUFNO|nr:PREDICTED: tRNA (guanine-N(7)-)-methyltransferase non-catalytic subunit wdr4 [Dufourea novaeangliae]KZC12832.1 tRNA (guanine-N(7)-)-methyltransferase subunit WDR4 [Dufourea novaeangliae]